jgi:hypothetical protein
MEWSTEARKLVKYRVDSAYGSCRIRECCCAVSFCHRIAYSLLTIYSNAFALRVFQPFALSL